MELREREREREKEKERGIIKFFKFKGWLEEKIRCSNNIMSERWRKGKGMRD